MKKRVLYIQDHLGLGGISTVSAAKQNWLDRKSVV